MMLFIFYTINAQRVTNNLDICLLSIYETEGSHLHVKTFLKENKKVCIIPQETGFEKIHLQDKQNFFIFDLENTSEFLNFLSSKRISKRSVAFKQQ